MCRGSIDYWATCGHEDIYYTSRCGNASCKDKDSFETYNHQNTCHDCPISEYHHGANTPRAIFSERVTSSSALNPQLAIPPTNPDRNRTESFSSIIARYNNRRADHKSKVSNDRGSFSTGPMARDLKGGADETGYDEAGYDETSYDETGDNEAFPNLTVLSADAEHGAQHHKYANSSDYSSESDTASEKNRQIARLEAKNHRLSTQLSALRRWRDEVEKHCSESDKQHAEMTKRIATMNKMYDAVEKTHAELEETLDASKKKYAEREEITAAEEKRIEAPNKHALHATKAFGLSTALLGILIRDKVKERERQLGTEIWALCGELEKGKYHGNRYEDEEGEVDNRQLIVGAKEWEKFKDEVRERVVVCEIDVRGLLQDVELSP